MRENAAVMVNILGGGSVPMTERYGEVLARFPDAKVHSYGKLPRPGRKIGHVTVTGDSLDAVRSTAEACALAFETEAL